MSPFTHDLSIDPGIGKSNGTGWVLWHLDGTFARAGLVRADKDATSLAYQAISIRDGLRTHLHDSHHTKVRRLYLEHMQIYGRQKAKGDPNDLVDVSYLEGVLAAPYDDVVLYSPHDWKGNVPNDVLERRIRAELIRYPGELDRLDADLRYVLKGLAHNTMAAVGIGLKGLGRLH